MLVHPMPLNAADIATCHSPLTPWHTITTLPCQCAMESICWLMYIVRLNPDGIPYWLRLLPIRDRFKTSARRLTGLEHIIYCGPQTVVSQPAGPSNICVAISMTYGRCGNNLSEPPPTFNKLAKAGNRNSGPRMRRKWKSIVNTSAFVGTNSIGS
jgi:hypothetical protein